MKEGVKLKRPGDSLEIVREKIRKRFEARSLSPKANTVNKHNSNRNYYSVLAPTDNNDKNDNTTASDDMQDPTNSSTTDKPQLEEREKVQPILVLGKTFADLREYLKKNNIPNVKFKLMTIGIKIFAETQEIHKTLVQMLAADEIKFFSYQPKEEQQIKIVLSGLEDVTTIELYDELVANDILFNYIKVFKPKNSEANAPIKFILYFKKGVIKLDELSKTKALFNTIVNWRYLQKKKNSYTQCRRCQMMGHGESNCYMPHQGQFCRENHNSTLEIVQRKSSSKKTYPN